MNLLTLYLFVSSMALFIIVAIVQCYCNFSARHNEMTQIIAGLSSTNDDQDTNPIPVRSQQQEHFLSGIRKISGIVFQYKSHQEEEEQQEEERSNNNNNNDCVICLDKFEEGEICRVLEGCNHVYHKLCIDRWLFEDWHCPLCRLSLRFERTVLEEVLDQV